MALFDSTSWTGMQLIVKDKRAIAKKKEEATMALDTYQEKHYETKTLERTAPHKLKAQRETVLISKAAIEEYRTVAAEVGLASSDLQVEEFRHYLAQADIPTFNLQEVIKYMDDIAAKDNPTGLGWHWCPVRPKDAGVALTWGRPSEHHYHSHNNLKTPASDFYESHRFAEWRRVDDFQRRNGGPGHPTHWKDMPSPAYTRTIPLHALKKIAKIEKEYKSSPVLFLVTDYTTQPHIIVNPDPFLMAVIPNSAVAHGKGRFVIDVWDEPGFGLDKMLKSAG